MYLPSLGLAESPLGLVLAAKNVEQHDPRRSPAMFFFLPDHQPPHEKRPLLEAALKFPVAALPLRPLLQILFVIHQHPIQELLQYLHGSPHIRLAAVFDLENRCIDVGNLDKNSTIVEGILF